MAPFFAADVDVRRGRVNLSGELDVLTGPKLAAAGAMVLRDGSGPVALSLREVAFIDAAGLGAIVSLRNSLVGAGRELLLVEVPRRIRIVFRCAGLAGLVGEERRHHTG
jgi:anti-anti-sigma factor